jgi:hypothetical protein
VSKFKPRRLERGSRIQAPQDESEPPDDKQRPKFCLEHVVSGFCVADCTKDQKAAFASRLREMSRLTWQQLRQAGRHGQGYEKIGRDSMKVAIPAHITEDVNLIAFRCFGLAPIIGYKMRTIFHIVWLDPKFQAYRH